MNIANVRILRMMIGTSLCLLLSQIVNWPMSFIAPVATIMILALPLPALKLSSGIKFIVVFLVTIYGSMLFLPFIIHYPAAGLLMVAVAYYWSFYFTAKGGSPIVGSLTTVGISLVAAVGSVSIDAVLDLASGLTVGIIAGVAFVWVGHAIMPDSKAEPIKLTAAAPASASAVPDPHVARLSAFRSLLVVMPVLLLFLLSAASASYAAVMIKVASMGQQASIDHTREAAKSLLASTVIGGIAATLGWELLSIWPSLILYVLLVALAGLLIGPRIFDGAAMRPAGATWSYGYVTMIIVLGPAVLDGQTGSSADLAFYSRLLMFMLASLYGVVAVAVFDRLFPSVIEPAQATNA